MNNFNQGDATATFGSKGDKTSIMGGVGKGIGNKTAQRIILDLKDKISKVNISKDILK